jgi:hypothetical protein
MIVGLSVAAGETYANDSNSPSIGQGLIDLSLLVTPGQIVQPNPQCVDQQSQMILK